MALTAYWQTPIGPYSPSYWPGAMIMDTAGNFTYGLMTDVTNDLRIIKITRSTLVITEDEVIAGHGGVAYAVNGDQDSTHLYLTVDTNHIIKVAKSDLTVTATGGTPGSSISSEYVARLRMGKGWSTGKVWGVMFIAGNVGSENRLISWDTTTMAVVDNVDLTSLLFNVSDLVIADSGDIYVIGENAAEPAVAQNFPLRLIKIATGLAVSGVNDFSNTFPFSSDSADVSMCYDTTDESIFIWNYVPNNLDASFDKIAKYVIGGATTYQTTDGNRWNTTGYSLSAWRPGTIVGEHRGVFAAAHDVQAPADPSDIIMYHASTLAVTLRIPMLSGYQAPHNLMLDPEGRLWMGAYNTDGDEDWLLVLNLSGALDTVRGYVSWAEMEMPDAAGGGGGGLEPYVLTYGTRWGLAMGLS